MAVAELIAMTFKINVFPLAVLGTIVVFGIFVWWVVARAREQEARVPLEGATNATVKPAVPQGTKIPAKTSPPVEAPPPTKDPGAKILEGADNAFDTEYWETALKFYKDYELWYAGTEGYDKNQVRVFERIHTSGAKMPKKDETLAAYVEARRRAADDWKRLKPLMQSPPTPDSRAQLKKYRDGLPDKDGRLAIIDAWLGDK